MIRLPRPAVTALVWLLGIIFVLVGVSKLVGPSALRWSERFLRWGYPAGAVRIVGIVEILSGLGMLVPKSRRVAAATAAGLMLGAACTHLVSGEVVRVISPLILGGLAFAIYRSRRTP